MAPDVKVQMVRQGTEDMYCGKCGKANHKTNGYWIVHKQVGLPLSEAAKAHFQKQNGSLKKKYKTNSGEEINTLISKKVEATWKASENN